MEKSLFKLYFLLSAIIVLIIGAIAVELKKTPAEITGGGGLGDFTSTSTNLWTAVPLNKVLRTGSGTLGRVVITVAPQTAFIIYDATTTNSSLRASIGTTSLNTLAVFPASATVGTYDFDAVYRNGLLFTSTGIVGTSTILYK